MAYDRPVLRLLLTYVVPLVLAIYCLVQAITSKDEDVRHLPKLAWILLIAFFPWIGAAAWLLVGQPRRERTGGGLGAVFPALREPDPLAPQSSDQWWPSAPEDDEDFQRRVRERAEEQRRAHRERTHREKAEGNKPSGEQTGSADGEPTDSGS